MYQSFLSPIDDYSNLPFRLLCQRYGVEAACVPLVNSTALSRNIEKIIRFVDAHPDEKNVGVQLVGNQPEEIGQACRVVTERFPFVKWLNLNCGCPSVRTMSSGGGSALLKTPRTIIEATARMKKASPVPISIKIRIRENTEKTVHLCQEIEEAGADFLIIHGRTAAQGYSGQADWELIRQVKEAIDIPLIGNGDIQSAAEGEAHAQSMDCTGYMIARAAMGNPGVFINRITPTEEERITMLHEYFTLHRRYIGELDLKDVRIKAMQFTTGLPGAAAMRNTFARATSATEIENWIRKRAATPYSY